jgi:UTP--glucose-1-phosphate uridylyltransferase
LLADDFLTDYEPGVTADLAQAFASSGKSQLSVMEVDGPDIQNTALLCQMGLVRVLRAWLKNLMR